MRLALYQPDIPQNLGAAIRLCACLGVALDVIEPCGFLLTEKALRRTALDYGQRATLARHASFQHFLTQLRSTPRRLVLVETDATASLLDFAFEPEDTLIMGRESAGSPPELLAAADASVRLPMTPGARSFNVAVAAAIALSEAMRQTGLWAALKQSEEEA